MARPAPDQIPGLHAWWRPDTLSLADGAAVSSWPDSGAGGHTATQADAARQPVYRASGGPTGGPSVEFNGLGRSMNSAAPSDLAATTIFAVLRTAIATGSREIRGATTGGLQWRFSDASMTISKRGFGFTSTSDPVITASEWMILSVSLDTTTDAYRFYRDGAPAGAGSNGMDGATHAATTYLVDPGSDLGGHLPEMVVYDRVLSDTERADVHSYLSDRTGIPVADYVPVEPVEQPVTVIDLVPAYGLSGSPTGETVEALDINVTLPAGPAHTVTGSPGPDLIAVTVAPTGPAAAAGGGPAGEQVDVATAVARPSGAPAGGGPSDETVAVAEPGLPAGGAPHVALWIVDRTTGALARLPHTLKVDLSPVRNSPGAFTFDYPAHGLGFETLRAEVQDRRRRVEVEMWVGGSRFNALRGYVLQYSGDDVAEDSIGTFSGHFLEWRMSDATLKHDAADEKGEVKFSARTPGQIVSQIVVSAQARGTLAGLDHSSFNGSLDSNGNSWPQVVTLKFTPYKTTYLTLLDRLVALGLCEWEITVDHQLHLYGPAGRGRDLTLSRPPARLRRAVSLMDSQRRVDLRDVGTDLYGTGAEGLFSTAAVDASARARIGAQIERAVDSNQIEDQDALNAFVINTLPTVTEPVVELTHGLVFGSNHPAPASGFRVGDWLYSDVGRGLERVRVVQWVLSQDVAGVTGSVTLNDTIGDRLTRLQRRLDALSDGSATVGTSQPPRADDTTPPAVPQGLVADSLAYQDEAQNLSVARLDLGWGEVLTNFDGTAADDVAGYDTELQYPSSLDQWVDRRTWSEPSAIYGRVTAGVLLRVRVRARDRSGNVSSWSTPVELITEDDSTPPLTPSALTMAVYLGQLRITSDGRGSAGEPMPADHLHTEIHLSQASEFTPTESTLIDLLTGPGTSIATGLSYGVTYYARAVAVDHSGNRSAASVQASAVPTKLVNIDLGPDAVDRINIRAAAIGSAEIDSLAVNSAHIASVAAGKITAGVMVADVVVGGRFTTSTISNSRVQLDNDGLKAFLNGALTVDINKNGNALFTGEIRSALTGMRMVYNDSHSQPRILFHSNLSVDQQAARIFVSISDVNTTAPTLVAAGPDPQQDNRRFALTLDGDRTVLSRYNLSPSSSESYNRLFVDMTELGGRVQTNGFNTNSFWYLDSAKFFMRTGMRRSNGLGTYLLMGDATGNQNIQLAVRDDNDFYEGLYIRAANRVDINSNGAVEIGNNTGTAYQDIRAKSFIVSSSRRGKRAIAELPSSAITAIRGAPVAVWHRADETDDDPLHIGPMLDDLPDWCSAPSRPPTPARRVREPQPGGRHPLGGGDTEEETDVDGPVLRDKDPDLAGDRVVRVDDLIGLCLAGIRELDEEIDELRRGRGLRLPTRRKDPTR